MNTKKLIAGFMFLLTFTGTVLKIPFKAQASMPRQILRVDTDTRWQPYTGVQTDYCQVESIAGATARLQKSAIKSAKPDDYRLSESVWAGSGNDYYFSQLDTREKNLYLNLKQAADRYLTGTDNFQMTKVTRNNTEVQTYILPMASYQGLSTEQMKKVFQCFLFENPQYYFMRNAVIYSEKSETMTIGLYEAFANGSERADYTAAFAKQLDEWEQQIELAQTVVEKETLIHQIVCDHVAYNNDITDNDPDDKVMSQSCISAVLFERSTVCMGYAQLFSLLCNRAGIPCVTVTSASHAWNKVRMGDAWYNVDCTWDDSRGDETFLNVTDRQLQAEDTKLAEHTLSPEWDGIAPACILPFSLEAANGADVEAYVSAPDKTVAFTLKSREKGKVSVEFEPLAGCDGYLVQYALNTSMDDAKKKETETAPYVLTDLKSGKTYYIRVRAYTLDSAGNKLAGVFSKKQKIIVK